MEIKVNSQLLSVLKKPIIRLSLFTIVLALLLSTVIYFRESDLRNEISFISVLIWQSIIWIPWILGYFLIEKFENNLDSHSFKHIMLIGIGMIWIGIHFTWFFLISSNFSPYLGKPATGYGVYPYFFIFWTFIDVIILGFIILVHRLKSVDHANPAKVNPVKIELTRGSETILCNPEDIQWLSSDNYYTNLQTSYGKFIMRNTLKHYFELLKSYGFIQIHRSSVVNIQYVNGLLKEEKKLFVVMQDGSKQAVSRNNIAPIKEKFKSLAT